MPTRGNPVLVARAIRGFQLQSSPERELVIVNSQPSEALAQMVAADSRIRLLGVRAVFPEQQEQAADGRGLTSLGCGERQVGGPPPVATDSSQNSAIS